MVTRRAAKSKGSQFEMSCKYSLSKIMPDIIRCGCEGFQLQYDLQSDEFKSVFECKRLKSMSWNQAEKFYKKLCHVTPYGYHSYLLFKSNRQPCLVMFNDPKYMEGDSVMVAKFDDVFVTPFIKHESTRNRKKICEDVNVK